jgi:hypothetical protein
VPDQLAVSIYLPDTMQWNGVFLAHIIDQFEIEVVCPVKNKRF